MNKCYKSREVKLLRDKVAIDNIEYDVIFLLVRLHILLDVEHPLARLFLHKRL